MGDTFGANEDAFSAAALVPYLVYDCTWSALLEAFHLKPKQCALLSMVPRQHESAAEMAAAKPFAPVLCSSSRHYYQQTFQRAQDPQPARNTGMSLNPSSVTQGCTQFHLPLTVCSQTSKRDREFPATLSIALASCLPNRCIRFQDQVQSVTGVSRLNLPFRSIPTSSKAHSPKGTLLSPQQSTENHMPGSPTSIKKSPVLRPACHATPPSSTDSKYCKAGKAGVGVNSSIGVSASKINTTVREKKKKRKLWSACKYHLATGLLLAPLSSG